MTKRTMHLTLRPNEKLFLNGAVIRTDRKVSLELMNDATFLLEAHVLQVEDTDTPLKQLYFAAQLILIDPDNAQQALMTFIEILGRLVQTFKDPDIVAGLKECIHLTEQERFFDILKIIRGLFDYEARIMNAQEKDDNEATQKEVKS